MNELNFTEKQVVPVNEDRLLEKVIDSGNIDILERFIALRAKEEERQARIAFEEAFTRMQSELPAVVKTKDNGATKSKYAPLEVIQRACDTTIHKHGFSYSWREESIQEGKRVWMDISGFGYTKSAFFDCPKIAGNNAQNAIQIAGAMSTYGRRYTFVSGFGIVVEGEDTDGHYTVAEFGEYRELLNPLYEAKTAAQLLAAAQKIRDSLKPENSKAKDMCNKLYAIRRKELGGN
jgi:hypothetical protein